LLAIGVGNFYLQYRHQFAPISLYLKQNVNALAKSIVLMQQGHAFLFILVLNYRGYVSAKWHNKILQNKISM